MGIDEKNIVKVLVAEDDFLVSREITRVVRSLGYEVIGEAANGLEAVEKTCALKPDVVLMDVQMPKLDGLKASELIQEQCPTPVVVLTAHASNEYVHRATETGVGAYLTKPPKPAEIERAVMIAMARHDDLTAYRRLAQELADRNKELEKALEEIKTLRGFLPICANCKKIRDDEGYWQQIETYIQQHSEAVFSHGICPDCMKELYPEIAERISKRLEGESS